MMKKKLSALSSHLSEGARIAAGFGISQRVAIRLTLSAVVILAAVPVSGTSPLAMRVEVQPTAVLNDGTTMEISVQLAPSDRGRIERQARMRIKLLVGSKTTAHILQDVDFDDQGMTRAQYTWPPGDYQLNLTVESLRGTAQGFWIGEIHIPASLDAVPAPTEALPKQDPSPTPVPPSQAAAPAAVMSEPVPAAPNIDAEHPPTETRSTTPRDPPTQPPGQAAEAQPIVPAPAVTPSAAETSAHTAPVAPTPVPKPSPEPIPEPRTPPGPPATPPETVPSGPSYILVLDIDPAAFQIADRGAALRASLDQRAEDVTAVIVQAGESIPTDAVRRALDLARSRPKTRAVVILSDVRRKASRSDWKQTAAAVRESGIPFFIIGLWNEEADPGTRKQFKNLASDSGGGSYQLQPSESPGRILEMLDSIFKANP